MINCGVVDLRVLGSNATAALDWMNREGLEKINQSTFLEIQGDSLSKDDEEFEAICDDMEARAKTARQAKESERRERRTGKLERVFDAFDLDGSGTVEKDELYELGNARRSLGQARGTWTEEKNNRLVERLDQNGDGQVSKEEFATEFEKMLTYNEEDFNEAIAQFMVVAEQVHMNKSRIRQERLENMNPIERAQHEAAAFTKDADIDIFKTRQEVGDKHDAKVQGEKKALDRAIKELLARRVREESHTELGCDETQEQTVRKEKEVATEEHKTAEIKQEQAVKVEEKKAEEVEVAIDHTQKAHTAHKRAVTVHQEAVVVVETKEEARSQRAKEVADLEELLRLARLALAVAEQELDEAQVVEVQR